MQNLSYLGAGGSPHDPLPEIGVLQLARDYNQIELPSLRLPTKFTKLYIYCTIGYHGGVSHLTQVILMTTRRPLQESNMQ